MILSPPASGSQSSERARNVSGPSTHRPAPAASSPLELPSSLLAAWPLPAPALPSDPAAVAALAAAAAVAATLAGVAGYRRFWRRLRNADSVSGAMLDRKAWVRGVVTSVGDGDNFRLFHTPGPFFRYPLKLRAIPSTVKELKDETLHIRIAGVDAPENAHFGNPAQPHAKESLDWLRRVLLGRRVRCQLLRKDQYGRIVAVPYISRTLLPDRPLPPLMLKEGMAVVYTSAGSEYGPWGLERLQALEAVARQKKKGLWALKTFEHPADYKKRIKDPKDAEAADDGMAARVRVAPRRGIWAWISRAWR
ncbi:putative endonuclease lcl3 [Cryptotrichosporon argae]